MAAEGAKIFRVMKTMILVIVMICAGLYSSAQEKKILDIPNSSPIIQSDTDNNKYIGLLMGHKADKVNALLRLDVVEYNDLKGLYNTELKQKVFKGGEEGIQLLEELKTLRQKVINSTSYFIFPLSINNGLTQEGKYNLKTKTFDITFKTEFPSIAGFVSFPCLAIKCNPMVKQSPFVKEKSYRSVLGAYEYYNTIKLPMSEKAAISIEENIGKVSLVVEFKIQQAKISSNGYYILQGTSTKLYIIDKNTHEIYFSL